MNDSDSGLLEVGRVTKAHGLNGEVVVVLTTDRDERLDPGNELVTPSGILTVDRRRPHQDRWIVKFAECDDRSGAEALNSTPLFAEPIDDDQTFWVHDLIGSVVVTPDGISRGVVESVIDAPASDLLSLDSGALVPVAFIVSEPREDPIVVDTPDGLFELFEN
ncbi:MAG: ribosome maturation factor RimM [Microthrixaceae bacterium]